MIIRMIWKGCKRFKNGPQDAYWLEATEQEAKDKIYPLLDDKKIEASIKFSKGKERLAEMMKNPGYTSCFVISKDTKIIRPFHIHYPVHQLWNAYSPFREIDKIEIANISEIIKIEHVKYK